TAMALARLGINAGNVSLTLFAPPGMYLDARTAILERFQNNNGAVEIRLKQDKKPRTWRYERIEIWPEGIGAAACFVLDDQGQPVSSDVLARQTVILDLGAYTLD